MWADASGKDHAKTVSAHCSRSQITSLGYARAEGGAIALIYVKRGGILRALGCGAAQDLHKLGGLALLIRRRRT